MLPSQSYVLRATKYQVWTVFYSALAGSNPRFIWNCQMFLKIVYHRHWRQNTQEKAWQVLLHCVCDNILPAINNSMQGQGFCCPWGTVGSRFSEFTEFQDVRASVIKVFQKISFLLLFNFFWCKKLSLALLSIVKQRDSSSTIIIHLFSTITLHLTGIHTVGHATMEKI